MPGRFRIHSNIDDEAIAWLARMTGKPGAAERQAFVQWQRRSPAHAHAWRQAQALLDAVGQVAAAQEYRQWLQAQSPPATGISRRALLAAGLSALALSGAGVYGLGCSSGGEQRTVVGERRALALPDGSRAWLNTASAVTMMFSPQQRGLRLEAGELFVEVASGAGPAFVVASRDARLYTQSARFALHQQGQGSVLTVLSGAVQLGTLAGMVTVAANQRVGFTSKSTGPVQRVDAGPLTAWTRGKLIFNQQPLQRIADEMERYLPGKVLVVGARLRALQLSGVFALDDLDALLRTVAALAGAQLLRLPLLHVIR